MNIKIKELAEHCLTTHNGYVDGRGNITTTIFDKEKFAMLIIKECARIAQNDWEEGTNEEGAHKTILKHFGIV